MLGNTPSIAGTTVPSGLVVSEVPITLTELISSPLTSGTNSFKSSFKVLRVSCTCSSLTLSTLPLTALFKALAPLFNTALPAEPIPATVLAEPANAPIAPACNAWSVAYKLGFSCTLTPNALLIDSLGETILMYSSPNSVAPSIIGAVLVNAHLEEGFNAAPNLELNPDNVGAAKPADIPVYRPDVKPALIEALLAAKLINSSGLTLGYC